MIKIILTKSGWESCKPKIDFTEDIVWINSGILSEKEIKNIRSEGLNLTCWTHHIGTVESIESALETVHEHHPNQEIWTETINYSS